MLERGPEVRVGWWPTLPLQNVISSVTKSTGISGARSGSIVQLRRAPMYHKVLETCHLNAEGGSDKPERILPDTLSGFRNHIKGFNEG